MPISSGPIPGKAVALPDDQTSIVYAKITDWAGNVTYLSTDDLTVDATAPEISPDVAENQIYCEDGLRIAFRETISRASPSTARR